MFWILVPFGFFVGYAIVRGAGRGAAASYGYVWVPGEVQGSLDTPQDGDQVYAVAQDGSGQQWRILISAEAIDGAGNFIGTVQDNGGFSAIANGQELTVPLHAVAWIVGR